MLPLIAALFLAAAVNAPAATQATDLRCEYRTNPLGIDVAQPRLSWRLTAPPDAKATHQTAYRVLVASSASKLQAAKGDLWDSGKVGSDQSVHVAYAGSPLGSGVKAFWKVQVWDQKGTPSAWSAPASWSMGVLQPSDWTAKWIGHDETTMLRDPASPFHQLTSAKWIWIATPGVGERQFHREVMVPESRGPVKKATAWIAAENRFDFTVNGKPAGSGNRVSMPTMIDITPLLAPGSNGLDIKVKHSNEKRPGGLIGAVRVEFATGEPIVILTGKDWTATDAVDTVVEVGPYGMAPWGDVGFREERWLPSRMLRTEFDAPKTITRATAHVSGLGLFELYVNGAKIGNDVLSPGLTEYPKRVLYVTYDVTAQLRQGHNALGVILGNGRYFGPRENDPTFARTFGFPKLLLQLDIEYSDGSKKQVVSDASWKMTTEGPVRGNNEYDGEAYDARRELAGWAVPGFKDNAWKPVDIVDAPGGVMTAQMAEPIRVTETIKPVKVTKIRPGVYVFDMGQNMVGWCRLHVSGKKGTAVHLRHAETLQEDGSLYVANLRSARAEDEYILKGGVGETWEPRFTYHGFRFVEITGYPGVPTLATIEGRVVHDAMDSAGSFETSDTLLNRIHKNTYWGVRGNYRSIPTDCPQRDERQGWMGDRSEVSRSETYLFNVAAFYTKWMTDIADAQREDGAISDVSPAYWPLYNNDVTWPSTFVLLPGTLYDQYGDTRVISRNYDAMKKWMVMMQGFLKDDLMPKDTYGDWCVPPESPEMIHSQDPARQTNKTLLATAYFHLLALKMSEYAKLIDRPQDVTEFAALAARLRTAFEKKFFKPEAGLYDNGTQTSSLLPLAFGMTETAQRPRVLDALVTRIHNESHDHIGTGLVGAQWLMRVLSDNGHADLAYTIATQKTYPGWGYMVERGATTVWELWNGDTADPGMNSGNHVMQIGDLTIWMYEYLGGIRPDPAKPGYKHFVVKPTPPRDLQWAKVTRKTMYGDIRSSWKRDKGVLTLNVVVPPNTSATVWVPGESTPREVESGTYSFTGKSE